MSFHVLSPNRWIIKTFDLEIIQCFFEPHDEQRNSLALKPGGIVYDSKNKCSNLNLALKGLMGQYSRDIIYSQF